MNRNELVTAMAEKSGLAKKDSDAALNAFMDVVKDALKKGDKIQLVGFGTFESAERTARTGRNPHDGSEVKIPAKRMPKFKAGKALKDALN